MRLAREFRPGLSARIIDFSLFVTQLIYFLPYPYKYLLVLNYSYLFRCLDQDLIQLSPLLLLLSI